MRRKKEKKGMEEGRKGERREWIEKGRRVEGGSKEGG